MEILNQVIKNYLCNATGVFDNVNFMVYQTTEEECVIMHHYDYDDMLINISSFQLQEE